MNPTPPGIAPVYPASLIVAGRPCLVVGGGPVAGRKIASLVECGAAVTVVAKQAHKAVAYLAETGALDRVKDHPIDLQLRPYSSGEAARFRLVIAATGVFEVDHAVARDAEEAGVWVNVADDPSACSFQLPAVYRDGPVTVSVSTGGASPALASFLKHEIARSLGPGTGQLAILLAEARAELQAEGLASDAIDWASILKKDLRPLLRAGHVTDARQVLREALDEAKHQRSM